MNVHYYDLDKGIHNSFNNAQCDFEYRNSIFKESNFLITHVDFKIKKNGELNLNYKSLSHEANKRIQSGQQLNPKDVSNIVSTIRMKVLQDPQIEPNAGSFFKNPLINKEKFKKLKFDYEDIPYFNSNSNKVKIPAAWLIETCGFKKIKFNNVSVHNNQSLVIVNLGKAQGIDIYKFSQKIKESVVKKFDILLEEEVNII